MNESQGAIVGPDVCDQGQLRPVTPVPDVDTFLEFLAQIESLVGPNEREPRPIAGGLFLL